ncbi:MAG: hypothetical protein FWE62_05400, partial [Firmicutes bacterium]|nr:hypothetical protein [Bacillota bacterium]
MDENTSTEQFGASDKPKTLDAAMPEQTREQDAQPAISVGSVTEQTIDTEAQEAPAAVVEPVIEQKADRKASEIPKPDREASTRQGKKGRLKLVYLAYAFLVALTFILSALSVNTGKADARASAYFEGLAGLGQTSAYNSAGRKAAADYITGALDKLGLTEIASDSDDKDTGEQYAGDTTTDAVPAGKSVYTVQEVFVTADERNAAYDLGFEEKETGLFMKYKVVNIIVYLPGADTNADAGLLMAGYDTKHNEYGASDLTAAAAMLASIEDNLSGGRENGLVYVFCDGEQLGHLGTLAFKNKFLGFDGVKSRVKAVAGFYPQGVKGAVYSMSNYGGAPGKRGGDFAAAHKDTVFGVSVYAAQANPAPVSIYTNYGGRETYRTAYDTYGSVYESQNQTACAALAGAYLNEMNRFASFAAGKDLGALKVNGDAFSFSYYNLFNIRYGAVMPYVAGGVLLALTALVVTLAALKKNAQRLLIGAVVAVLSLAGAVGAGIAVYYVVGGIFSLVGVVPYGILSIASMYSFWTLAALCLTALAGYFAFNIIFKRIFRSKAHDVSDGNALVVGIAAAFICFFVPAASFIAGGLALFNLLALNALVIHGAAFTKKRFSPYRLFPYVLPLILSMPLLVAPSLVLGAAFGAKLYALLLVIFIASVGGLAPYYSYLTDTLTRVFAKIKAPVKIVRTETVREEDKAKKGKFTTVTKEAVRREWRPLKYSAIAASAALFLTGVILSLSLFGIHTSAPYALTDDSRGVYANALVYVNDFKGGSQNSYWMIQDRNTYKEINKRISGFEWDTEKGIYIKSDTVDKVKAAQYRGSCEPLPAAEDNEVKLSIKPGAPDTSSSTYDLCFNSTGLVT